MKPMFLKSIQCRDKSYMNLHSVSVANTAKINRNINYKFSFCKRLQEQKLEGYIPGKFVFCFVCKLLFFA